MKVSLFDFALPETLIASRPANPRDAARMLVVGEALQDAAVRDLPHFLKPGDLLIFNDTRVIPARLFGQRGQSRVEVLLHRELEAGRWRVFARPAKRLRPGDTVQFAGDFSATVEEKLESGEVVLRFDRMGPGLREALSQHGQMPLPPYIERIRHADAKDRADYQTVYAREEGSVAAPTAGLHFTKELLEGLEKQGVRHAFVTLHVGGGTFLPVKVENTQDHVMHAEYAQVSDATAKLINETRAKGGRVVAVGTTSLRTLESAADENGTVHPFHAETSIFITPGYAFRAVDMLLTNFHLPKSTLFMLVCAFAGMDRMRAAYAHAIVHQYRFYSYGDACLLSRAQG